MYGAILSIFTVHVQQTWTTECRPNRINAAELWRHIDFFKMAAATWQFYFRFRLWRLCSFGKVETYLQTKISATYLNPQLRYYYFRFLKTNGCHVRILLPVSIFTFASPSECHSASAYQISSKSDHQRHSYDVISILQNGDHSVSILLPILFYVTSLIWKCRNLPADQIAAIYLNPRLRYYYIRFLKTNGRHVRILLPVSIFMFAPPSACHSASAYQISSKSTHPRRSYDVISIF